MVKDGNQLNALKVLLEETERAKRFGFTQTELDRAKSQIMSNIERTYNNRDKTESDALVEEIRKKFPGAGTNAGNCMGI